VERLQAVFQEVDTGERTPNTALALCTIAMTISKLLQAGDLELRTRELERKEQEREQSPENQLLRRLAAETTADWARLEAEALRAVSPPRRGRRGANEQ
jgi:hypothetical protein